MYSGRRFAVSVWELHNTLVHLHAPAVIEQGDWQVNKRMQYLDSWNDALLLQQINERLAVNCLLVPAAGPR